MPPLAESSTAGKKRRTNIGTACLNCRRRKARCDGEKPTCNTCTLNADTCEWAEEQDGRKSVNRQYVNSLRERIKTLEAALQEKGQDYSPMPDEEDEEEEDVLAGVSRSVLHLHMGEAGEEVHFHGPTSAYAHLAHVQLSVEAAAEEPVAPIGHSHDYRRFLPPSVAITHTQHTEIIDRFFRFYASWCQRAVPNLFHQDMIRAITLPPNTPLPRFTHYSPFLHNIILAMALRWADDPVLNTPRNRMTFAAAAEMHLSRELPRPTLATVQGLAFKSSYHSTLGDHTGGWAYFGMADRAAQSLGLNIDCSALVQAAQMSEQEMLLRRNTFWSIFTQEHMWSVYLGRPQPVPEYSVPLPTVDKQLDSMQWTWDDPTIPGIPGPSQDCCFSTAFVETTKLSLIINRVMASLYSFRSEKAHKDRVVAELGVALDTWNDQLPHELTLSGHSLKNALPHIIMLQLAREWTTILIYRPYYRPVVNTSKVEKDRSEENLCAVAVKRCDRAALRINSLLAIYHSRFGLRFSPPTLFNITFTGGTTYLLAAVRHRTNKVRETAITGARECIGYLYNIGESWPAARHKGDILAKMVEDYHLESVDQSGGGMQAVEGSPLQESGGPSSTMPRQVSEQAEQPSTGLGSAGMNIPATQMGQMEGLGGGWDYGFNPTASLSTSPTFDPNTWNILPASSTADEQNSLLARLVAQMTANSTPFQASMYDGNGAYQPYNPAGPSRPTPSTQAAQAQQTQQSSINGDDLHDMQGSQGWQRPQEHGRAQLHPWRANASPYSDLGGPMSFTAPAASPPFNLDVDAQLLNELFASYTGSGNDYSDRQSHDLQRTGGSGFPISMTSSSTQPAPQLDHISSLSTASIPQARHTGSAPIPTPYQGSSMGGTHDRRQMNGTSGPAPVRSYFGSS